MPYKIPKAKIMYFNKNSRNSKTVLKQRLNIINERFNKRLSKQENILEINNEYELIMKKCRYFHRLKYENYEQNPKTKIKRNIIWYTPPISKSVKSIIGRKCINLLKNVSINLIPQEKFSIGMIWKLITYVLQI